MDEASHHAMVSGDQVVGFGPFELYPGRRALLKDGRPIAVGSRALEILIALIDRPGKLFTKDELIRCAWPTTIVEESSLRAQITALRKALGEDGDVLRYVATVPGRGYRFVASVSYPDRRDARAAGTVRRHNLPTRLTAPIGRDAAVNTVKGRLSRYRLTTIVGPGGIGKTTVCLAAAEDLVASYEDGVCFLDLAPLADPHLLPSVLATVLGVAAASEDPLSEVASFLRKKRMLLIFDSCERLLPQTALLIETLLKEAAGVNILATSREALRAEGESVYRLPPLELPSLTAGLSASHALTFSAIQLFVERAASGTGGYELDDHDAPIVADICRQLDGIALAIELAAARVEAFGPRGIAERLDDSLRLLSGGRRTALPRHQTLRATLDWSYDSLPNIEQRALRRFGVFAGSFTFECARAVVRDTALADDDTAEYLASLVAKSLVTADSRGSAANYRLLDTTQAYAFARLAEAGELDIAMRRLTEYLCRVLDKALADFEFLSSAEWLRLHACHVDNVRKALDWAFSPQGDCPLGTALTVAAIPLWFQLSSVDECRDGVERALSSLPAPGRLAQAREVMDLYRALGLSRAFTVGLAPQAAVAFAKALDIAESLEDTEEQLEALWGLWFCQLGAGQYRASLATGQRFRKLAANEPDQRIGDRLISTPLLCMGDLVNARAHMDGMLAHRSAPEPFTPKAVRFRFDQFIASRVLVAHLLWLQGFPDQALLTAQGGLEEAQAARHGISLCEALARGLCPICLFVGDLTQAQGHIGRLLDCATTHGLSQWEILGRCWKGALLIRRGEFVHGTTLLKEALQKLQTGRLFSLYSNAFLGTLAEGLLHAGQSLGARATVEEALARCEREEELWCLPELLRIKAEVLRHLHRIDDAEQHLLRALDWAQRQCALSWELRIATSLAALHRDRGQGTQGRTHLSAVYGRFTEGFTTSDLRIARTLLDTLP
jgi:predicted ATPase/DNA-binding winged helix-turn-helix (wHTH) protein